MKPGINKTSMILGGAVSLFFQAWCVNVSNANYEAGGEFAHFGCKCIATIESKHLSLNRFLLVAKLDAFSSVFHD